MMADTCNLYAPNCILGTYMTLFMRTASTKFRWISLALGTLALSFANGATAVPIAAWLAPLLLLCFVMATRPLVGFVLMSVSVTIASLVTLRGVIPVPQAEFVVTCLISGVLGALPYLFHRLVAPRVGTIIGTLAFPSFSVALLYLLALASPFGTWGVDGYVQADFIPLTQFASLAGVWGVTFMVFWFASAVQAALQWHEPRAHTGLVAFGCAFAAILVWGGLRMASVPAPTANTTVAALTTPIGLPEKFFEGCVLRDDQACRDKGARKRLEAFFASSADAADAGAKLLVWPEAAAQFDQSLEDEFAARASTFAREHAVHLVAGVALVPTDTDAPMINKAIVFAPSGELSFEYHKSVPVPGEPIVAGDGKIHTVDTPFGRLGVIICFDADFPLLSRQARALGVDVLAIPANDWRAITPLHGEMSRFRAIENGFSVVRATSNGLSLIADTNGRVLDESNSFEAPGERAHAPLSVASRSTMYSRIGDAFIGVCLTLVAILLLISIVSARRRAQDQSHPDSLS